MIKATGSEFCSKCHGGVRKGDDLMEGSAVTDDSGALYHPGCYFELCREEDARPHQGDKNMITIDQLQTEQYTWARKNFGPCRIRWPLMGVFEETGELLHSQLKQEQKIRGPEGETDATKIAAFHDAKKKDAVADIIIYLLEYCSCMGWRVVNLLVEEETTFRELQNNTEDSAPVWDCIGKIVPLAYDETIDGTDVLAQEDVVQILLNLAIYCRQRGWSLQELVEITWARVSKRDWTKNKTNGGDTADEDAKKLGEYLAFLKADKGKQALRRYIQEEVQRYIQEEVLHAAVTAYDIEQKVLDDPRVTLARALALADVYHRGLRDIAYPTDEEAPQARALRALEETKPFDLDAEKPVEVFVLRADDPHAPSALYGYSESVRHGYENVQPDEARANAIWATADHWGSRQGIRCIALEMRMDVTRTGRPNLSNPIRE